MQAELFEELQREGRSVLVSREGGYERTWSPVRIHLGPHRPRARTNAASNFTLSHGTIEKIPWVNPLGIKVLTDSFKSHIF